VAASVNWTNMWKVVTRSGDGKPKYFSSNIHLLYSEIKVAKKNLWFVFSTVLCERLST
jgi:hypothetical protein